MSFHWLDVEKLKEVFGEPGNAPGEEMLKAPYDDQYCHPRVKCTGFVDEMTMPEEDTLTFGLMDWGVTPKDPNILFYADGLSCMAIDSEVHNPRFRLANRINNRIKKSNIQSIFVTRKTR